MMGTLKFQKFNKCKWKFYPTVLNIYASKCENEKKDQIIE